MNMVTSKKFPQLACILLFTFTIISLGTITLADVPRPRGVALSKATLYKPRSDDTWICLDGSRTVKFLQINDDYCDCSDGSDEPGTPACTHGTFHCANRGHRPQDIPSSRVNDGICDCCDGSDEYLAEGMCSNTCMEMGRAEQEQRKSQAEMHKKGSAKRYEMVARGKQIKAEREKRRSELEVRRQEQESLKAEKEQLKKQAEAGESEALDYFKEQQKEKEALNAADIPPPDDSMRSEAAAWFMRYDSNKDGFVEITELQLDLQLDRDRNGVVTVEEAKYFLDERDRMDLDSFVSLSWPRIKPMQMIAQGLFTPPEGQGENDEVAELLNEDEQEQRGDQKSEEDHQQQQQGDDEEEEEIYEDEEADIGTGSVQDANNNTPAPEYDPETQRFIDMANEARNALSEVERGIREIDQEIKELDDQNAKDYGPHDEYATLEGECFKLEDREYVYTLCPFERASQQARSGGAETTLGRWDQWLHEGDNKYAKQKYAHGASCWNGPQRSVVVQLKCALESRITGVSEPNRCEYYFDFETPAACDEDAFNAAEQRLKDEL